MSIAHSISSFIKNLLLYSPMHRSDKPSMCNNDQGRVYPNCKFLDPRGRGFFVLGHGHVSHSENALFLLNLLSKALIRQTKYIVMMTKEGCAKIVNFM